MNPVPLGLYPHRPHLLVLSVSVRFFADSCQVPVPQTGVFLHDGPHGRFEIFLGGGVAPNCPLRCHGDACRTPDDLIENHGSLLSICLRLLVQIQEVIRQEVDIAIVT